MSNEFDDVVPLFYHSINLVPSTNQNQYRYNFPAGGVTMPPGTKVAIGSVAIYYSWKNITAAYGNNVFQIFWPTGGAGVGTTYTVTIPDGSYSIPNLNSYLQQFCITNGLYLVNASGNNVYYIEVQTNSVSYSIMWNFYPIPTSLPVGYTQPSGWPGYPSSTYTPQLIVLSNAFQTLTGFAAGTFPSTQQTTTQSAISTSTPQVSPVQSIIIGSNILNNIHNINPTLLYTFSPAGVTFGNIINSSPNFAQWVKVQNGTYTHIDITFYDQTGSTPLAIVDTDLTVQLMFKYPEV